MPVRKTPLVSGEYYHVFNHGIDYHDICETEREYRRLLLALWFYQSIEVQLKLSHYLSTSSDVQQNLINEINNKPRLIELHAFSIMPNHYHLLVKQLMDNGISTFIGNFQNSYTKYFNAKYERLGSLFLTPFRAKRIYTEEQFLHVTRYIHLNRYSSGFITELDQLRTDPYSSLPYYIHTLPTERLLVYTNQLESMFSNPEKHWEFIQDNADYQRQLEHIKHLIEE
jgi:putative transposase